MAMLRNLKHVFTMLRCTKDSGDGGTVSFSTLSAATFGGMTSCARELWIGLTTLRPLVASAVTLSRPRDRCLTMPSMSASRARS